MASAPNTPPPSPDSGFESASEIFPIKKKLEEARKFLRTRSAIINGDRLYDNTKGELESLAVMGPWKFNLMQSTICALPGMMIVALGWVVGHPLLPVKAPLGDPLQQKIYGVLEPLGPPFVLLFSVYLVAYCCLPSGFVTKHNWNAAKRKYLYLDATFGIWPQFILASSLAVLQMAVVHPQSQPSVVSGELASLTFFVTLIWQGFVTAFKVREGMFDYDYIPERETMFASLLERPMLKFYLLLALGLPIVIFLVTFVLALTSSIGAAIMHKL